MDLFKLSYIIILSSRIVKMVDVFMATLNKEM